MITRIYGKVNFECDGCGEILDTETKDFEQALATAKRDRWHISKLGTEWIHRCPDCKLKPGYQ